MALFAPLFLPVLTAPSESSSTLRTWQSVIEVEVTQHDHECETTGRPPH